jgi:hypothetical protein
MSLINKILIVLFLTAFWTKANAQKDTLEMWVNISPELKIGFEDRIWEIRFRPDDHIFLPAKYVPTGNQAKMELMLGFNFWKFKLFSHSKYDQAGNLWSGLRFDFNFEMFDKKLLFNIQERYFFGSFENKKGSKPKDHYYLIQYIRYKIAKKSVFGVLGFGKWNFNLDPITHKHPKFNTGNWFIGPSLAIEDPSSLGIQLAFTKDVFNKPYMTYLRLSYSITFKNMLKPIDLEIAD